MGRSNLIILFFGVFACIALSLMMSHVVGIKEKKDVHPAVFDIQGLYGDDMARRPKLAIEMREGRRVAVMTVWPRHMVASGRLARMVGRHLISMRGPDLQFEALEIVAQDPHDKDAAVRSFPIEVPRGYNRFSQRLLPQPPPRSGSRRVAGPGTTPAGAKSDPQRTVPSSTPKPPQRPSGPAKRP